MAYLRMYLPPEIRSGIVGLLTQPSHYHEALQALKSRYGHPGLLAKANTAMRFGDNYLAQTEQRMESGSRGREIPRKVHNTAVRSTGACAMHRLCFGCLRPGQVLQKQEGLRSRWLYEVTSPRLARKGRSEGKPSEKRPRRSYHDRI